MLHDKIALLRTLALRPSRTVVQNLQPLLEELVREGYVARDKDAGWMTTAKGCTLIENSRPTSSSNRR
jgi:predicted transcriptional regulator